MWCRINNVISLYQNSLHTGAFLYVPYNFLLISNKFWMGGSSAVMLLNRTNAIILLNRTGGVASAQYHLWAPEHKTTNAPHGPVRNAFDVGSIHYLGKWKGVGPWKSPVFWAPNGSRLSARCHLTGPKKSRFPGSNPLPLALVIDDKSWVHK
jgi:hypothetical protein